LSRVAERLTCTQESPPGADDTGRAVSSNAGPDRPSHARVRQNASDFEHCTKRTVRAQWAAEVPMLRLRLRLLLAAWIVFVPITGAAGQGRPNSTDPSTSTFTLRGFVLDATRAPVAGARVSVAASSSRPSRSTLTDQHGEFAVSLPAGRYLVTVTGGGFGTVARQVEIPESDSVPREFLLAVAGVRESVSVSAPAGGYGASAIASATRTETPLLDVPQSITVVTKELMRDQLMLKLADVVRYMPGVTAHQGENNRDQVVLRGNNSSADFFLDGVRDDVQYYRDLYNLDRVEALKGPNAMIFGRGGGGGVINRVSKEAVFEPLREFAVTGGSFGTRRITADVGQPLGSRLAVRVNAVYENSGSFRHGVSLERHGVNPTFTVAASARTQLTVAYEHFRDNRAADRGIPSFQGRPAGLDVATYFGNPQDSDVKARVDRVSARIVHRAGTATISNRTVVGGYERSYQNYVPGAVSPDKATVLLTAYNNDTRRLNVFSQTDVTLPVVTGPLRHTVLAGAEVGRQFTDNIRNTGYFDNVRTSILVPYDSPTTATPVAFRQSATDPDNHLRTTVAAAYAQDQVDLARTVQLLAGIRIDSFTLDYHNNRTGDDLGRSDRLVSPRLGVVIKPMVRLSVYGSYTVSYLPSAGDQFSSLTTITEQVKPEKFGNYEVGAKWDLRPQLSFTFAAYRLDRTNTRATDPNDPTRIVQTGSQRTEGCELGISGRVNAAWQIAGGYAYQDATVTSATTAAARGAAVAQVPRHTLSLWNSYQLHRRFGMGLGIVRRAAMFAAIDNAVTLPGYTEVDAAAFVPLAKRARLQVNIENLFDRTYYANADGNNNISPGSPRAIRLAVTTKF
jgi:catecholate siderophore receptor